MCGLSKETTALIILIYTAIVVFSVGWSWIIFVKAGIEGWKCLIPFYSSYCLTKIVFGNGWLFLITLIPIVGSIFDLVRFWKLAKVFGGGIGMCLLMLFIPIIGYGILAFGDAEYTAPENWCQENLKAYSKNTRRNHKNWKWQRKTKIWSIWLTGILLTQRYLKFFALIFTNMWDMPPFLDKKYQM